MSRNERVLLIQATPSAVTGAFDAVMVTQGFVRTATQTIQADFTPLLHDQEGAVAVVMSEPHGDWLACWTSLELEAEWAIAEAIARGLEQPVACTVLVAEPALYAYRYWEDGSLRAEAVPGAPSEPLDERALLAHLADHGIPPELVDDRRDRFGQEHIVLGYMRDMTEVTPQGTGLVGGLN